MEEEKILLPERESITFQFGEHWADRIRVRKEGNHLDVNSGSFLLAAPRSGNVLWLYNMEHP